MGEGRNIYSGSTEECGDPLFDKPVVTFSDASHATNRTEPKSLALWKHLAKCIWKLTGD